MRALVGMRDHIVFSVDLGTLGDELLHDVEIAPVGRTVDGSFARLRAGGWAGRGVAGWKGRGARTQCVAYTCGEWHVRSPCLGH